MRAHIDRLSAARSSRIACSLVLVSILLAGCNLSDATSSLATASTSTTQAVSSSATPPKTSTTPTAGMAGGSPATPPVSSTPTPTVNHSADVSWAPPTTNTNGTVLTDLAGYRIYYGTSPDTLNQTADVASAGATDYVIQNLAPGTWYFAVAAYTNTGLQSGLSSIASKTIT